MRGVYFLPGVLSFFFLFSTFSFFSYMKTFVAFIFSFLCCIGVAAQSGMLDEGVSHVLAQHRSRTVSDVRYQLHFSLSSDKDAEVQSEVCIRLRMAQRDDIILDFREAAEKIHGVSVNGKACRYTFQNEHIIIPKSCVRKGDNDIRIAFVAGKQSLNHRGDYVYTLFVPDRARTVFPCMDQPDIKARFTLSLTIPEEWEAVTNARLVGREGHRLTFAETEPLPTYLFAFAAGRFERTEYSEDGHTIGIYHRETDPMRLAQIPDIGHQVVFSLKWQEDYTGVAYPFQKYDLVILPGFQFGGMEHTGATFYNDNTIFLPANPTPDEQLRRTELISHETTHMWFGDAVTMRWFDDVWTKEVFANYFASEITAPLFPELNHRLNWQKTYMAAALSEDRTTGGTSIRQPLDNLRAAGLVYNQIIYNKAPVMMRKLVELMGEDAFRRGVQEYVKTFLYGNATWDDLVSILDAQTPHDIRAFSEVWVNQRGMPTLYCEQRGDSVVVTETDPYDRGLHWEQQYECRLTPEGQILPNYDGRGYGFFTMDDAQLRGLLHCWPTVSDATARQSLLATLFENYLHHRFSDVEWLTALLSWIGDERDPLTASTIVGFMTEPLLLLSEAEAAPFEQRLREIAGVHAMPAVRTQLLRLLYTTGKTPTTTAFVRDLWEKGEHPLLSDRDFMAMTYELAVRLPEESDALLEKQLSRITHPDRREEFCFISRAVVSDEAARDSVFESLSQAANRRIEPWAHRTLYYLNHPLRQAAAVKYIRPALEWLPDIQRTGDIFFPGTWCAQLLAGHRSAAAYREVEDFLATHTDYPQLLRNKILLAKYGIERALLQ